MQRTDDSHFDPKEQLRSVGLRVTAPRVAVLDMVARNPHSDADEVAAAVRDELGKVSTSRVRRTQGLRGRGLLRRIEPAGSPARFETRTGDNHHHLVCRNCGTVVDVDCAVGAAPCLTPSDAGGFVVDEAEVTFWGLCQSCR